MIFESEKTFLLYYKNKSLCEQKRVIPVNNIIFFINRKAGKVILSFDDEIKGLFKDLKDFVLDITNDPNCDPKYPITNLGYFSIRFEGENGIVHNNKGRIILEFPINKFLVFFNLPVYLYLNKDVNFRELFNYRDEDFYLLRLEFLKTNYEVKAIIFRDGDYVSYNIDLLKIEDNHTKNKSKKIDVLELLKRYGLF